MVSQQLSPPSKDKTRLAQCTNLKQNLPGINHIFTYYYIYPNSHFLLLHIRHTRPEARTPNPRPIPYTGTVSMFHLDTSHHLGCPGTLVVSMGGPYGAAKAHCCVAVDESRSSLAARWCVFLPNCLVLCLVLSTENQYSAIQLSISRTRKISFLSLSDR